MSFTKIAAAGIGSTETVTLHSLEVLNNATIGGVLTYEDVTNVDSIGIITARAGVLVGSGITLSKDGDIFATGVTTATTFVGALTGTASLASNLTGTPNISCGTIAGSTGTFSGAVSGTTGTFSGDVSITDKIIHAGDTDTAIRFPAADTITSETGGSERARIDSSGRLLIGTATASSAGNSQYSKLEVSGNTSGATGAGHLSIKRGTAVGSLSSGDTLGRLVFSGLDGGDFAYIQVSADAAPGSSDYPGRMMFFTTADGASSSTERLRITSDGYVNIGGNYTQTTYPFQLTGSGGGEAAAMAIKNEGSHPVKLHLMSGHGNWSVSNSTTVGDAFEIRDESANATRMMITSDDKILMGGSAAYATFENSSTNPRLQVRGSDLNGSCQAWIRASADAGAPKLFIANSRSTAQGGHTVVQSGDEIGQIHFAGSDGSQFVDGCQIRGAVDGTPGADDMPGRLTFHTTADGSATCTERMRIHNNGKMSFNNTSFPYGETFHFYNGLEGSCASFYQNSSNDHTNVILRHGRALSGYNGYQMLFKRNDGTNVGSIISGASSTSFNTSSDYRLKENQITIPNAIDKLNKLKPYEFNFKDDPDYKHLGFFAHEVQEIIPNGVAFGEKDEVYTEDSPSELDDYKKGDMKIQSLDYGKLTPLLTAALQEAITEIETLKAKVAALEG